MFVYGDRREDLEKHELMLGAERGGPADNQ
jgi:hypothetical protein